MKPTFQNAVYWRDTDTDETYQSIKEIPKENLHSVVGVHSKLLLSDSRGVYIPRDFIESFDLEKWNILNQKSDLQALSDTNNEWYWEAWNNILSNAYRLDEHGIKWALDQDGDLFAIAEIEYSEGDNLECED